jgi:hypothetical protein
VKSEHEEEEEDEDNVTCVHCDASINDDEQVKCGNPSSLHY